MPVYPVTWEKFGASGRYRHMFKHDIAIWERFITAYNGAFELAAYDIALGGVTSTNPNDPPEMRKMWQYSTAKKIDAAVSNDAECWLCEVRPGAGLSAVGSVVGYSILSERDPWTTLPLILTIVTDQMDADTKLVCQELDIQVIEVPEPAQLPTTVPVLDPSELHP